MLIERNFTKKINKFMKFNIKSKTKMKKNKIKKKWNVLRAGK